VKTLYYIQQKQEDRRNKKIKQNKRPDGAILYYSAGQLRQTGLECINFTDGIRHAKRTYEIKQDQQDLTRPAGGVEMTFPFVAMLFPIHDKIEYF
jgi:hypothetical protein